MTFGIDFLIIVIRSLLSCVQMNTMWYGLCENSSVKYSVHTSAWNREIPEVFIGHYHTIPF